MQDHAAAAWTKRESVRDGRKGGGVGRTEF